MRQALNGREHVWLNPYERRASVRLRSIGATLAKEYGQRDTSDVQWSWNTGQEERTRDAEEARFPVRAVRRTGKHMDTPASPVSVTDQRDWSKGEKEEELWNRFAC